MRIPNLQAQRIRIPKNPCADQEGYKGFGDSKRWGEAGGLFDRWAGEARSIGDTDFRYWGARFPIHVMGFGDLHYVLGGSAIPGSRFYDRVSFVRYSVSGSGFPVLRLANTKARIRCRVSGDANRKARIGSPAFEHLLSSSSIGGPPIPYPMQYPCQCRIRLVCVDRTLSP